MDPQRLEMQWHGPYKWYGKKCDSIFTQPLAKQAGIYLWTIPFKEQFLTYYVGETGRSFVDRFIEHTREYLYGLYRIYDPVEFAKGRRKLIWGGMWKKELGPRAPRMLEFLNRYLEFAPIIYEFLGQFRLFIAPLNVEERVRQRIESAIADRLREQPGIIGSFQDSDVRYRPRRVDEELFSVKMVAFEPILGLCSGLMA